MEGLLENVRQLSRELRQHMLIIDQFIPPEYQVWWTQPFLLAYLRTFDFAVHCALVHTITAHWPWKLLPPRKTVFCRNVVGTAAAAPPPFRLGDPAVPSHPI